MSRDVTLDREGDVIMVNYSAQTPVFAVRSRKKFRTRLLQVTGCVKELGLILEIPEPGEPANRSPAGYQTMGGVPGEERRDRAPGSTHHHQLPQEGEDGRDSSSSTQSTRQSPTTPGAVARYEVIPIGNINVSQINS